MKTSTYTVYHNPRCSKSRNALTFLEDKNETFKVVEYLKQTPTKEDLKSILKMLDMPAFDLIRKNEADYKDNFKGNDLSEDEWIEAMIQYPKLIERPIVIKNGKAVVARPTENIEKL